MPNDKPFTTCAVLGDDGQGPRILLRFKTPEGAQKAYEWLESCARTGAAPGVELPTTMELWGVLHR